MKKLIMAFAIMGAALAAKAEFNWCWWTNGPSANDNIKGCQLGIASECKNIMGAQISLLWGRVERADGCQGAIGYVNCKKMVNGPQVAIVNIAREGAALQLGLLNFNPKGFLPFFPFFNFSPRYFGDKNRM